MSYETKLIIGTLSSEDNYLYKNAEICLSNNYSEETYSFNHSNQVKKNLPSVYIMESNEIINKDCYGKKMHASTAIEVLNLLKSLSAPTTREKWALSLLESMINSDHNNDLTVIFYNH